MLDIVVIVLNVSLNVSILFQRTSLKVSSKIPHGVVGQITLEIGRGICAATALYMSMSVSGVSMETSRL